MNLPGHHRAPSFQGKCMHPARHAHLSSVHAHLPAQDASGVEWSVRVLPRRGQAPTVPIFFAVMKMQ